MLFAVTSDEGRTGFIDQTGRVRIPFDFDDGYESDDGYLRVVKRGRYGLMTEDGVLVSEPQWAFISHRFENGRVNVSRGSGANRRVGCLDLQGQVVIPVSFQELSVFSCGRCGALLPSGDRMVIDQDGNEVFRLKFSGIFSGYSEERLRVQQIRKGSTRIQAIDRFGFLDLDGRLRIPTTLKYATNFKEGLSCVATGDDVPQAIDQDGNVRFSLDPSEYDAPSRFSEGRAVVPSRSSELKGVIDTEGRIIVPPIIVETNFARFTEGLLTVGDRNRRWGYMNLDGEMVIPYQFYRAESFVDGRAVVAVDSEDGPQGLIDPTGEFTVEPKYRTLTHRGERVWHGTRLDEVQVLLTDEGVVLWESR